MKTCVSSAPSSSRTQSPLRGRISLHPPPIMSLRSRAFSQPQQNERSQQAQLDSFFPGQTGRGREASKMAPAGKVQKTPKAAQTSAVRSQQKACSPILSPQSVSDSAPPVSPGSPTSLDGDPADMDPLADINIIFCPCLLKQIWNALLTGWKRPLKRTLLSSKLTLHIWGAGLRP